MKNTYENRKWAFELDYNKYHSFDISLNPSIIDSGVYSELIADIKYFLKEYKNLPKSLSDSYKVENIDLITDQFILDIIKNGFKTADTHVVAMLSKSPSDDISFDISQPARNETTSFGVISVESNLTTCYSSDDLKIRCDKLLEENFKNLSDFPQDQNGVRCQSRALISWELNFCISGYTELNSIIATDELVFTSSILELD